jgi:hypothetical protein
MMSGSLGEYSIDVLLSVLGRHGGRLTVRLPPPTGTTDTTEVVCKLHDGRLTDLRVDGRHVTEPESVRLLLRTLRLEPDGTFAFEGSTATGPLDLALDSLSVRRPTG